MYTPRRHPKPAPRRYRSQTNKYTEGGYGRLPPDVTVQQMFVQLPVDLLPKLIGCSGQAVVLAALLRARPPFKAGRSSGYR
jgi:hypothetical protein